MKRGSGPVAGGPPQRGAAPRRKATRGTHPDSGQISPLTINRLSLYLRSLRQLEGVGVARVSSSALARFCQLSAAQVRKDLAAFGDFGTRGLVRLWPAMVHGMMASGALLALAMATMCSVVLYELWISIPARQSRD